MRREERVTVQGTVKEQQPDGMSHWGPVMLVGLWRAVGRRRGLWRVADGRDGLRCPCPCQCHGACPCPMLALPRTPLFFCTSPRRCSATAPPFARAPQCADVAAQALAAAAPPVRRAVLCHAPPDTVSLVPCSCPFRNWIQLPGGHDEGMWDDWYPLTDLATVPRRPQVCPPAGSATVRPQYPAVEVQCALEVGGWFVQ